MEGGRWREVGEEGSRGHGGDTIEATASAVSTMFSYSF